MNRALVVRFAASAALLGTVAVGCKPATHPAALSSSTPRADRQAMRRAGQAGAALAKQETARGVKLAEEAVALAPGDATNRLLLGRAYIAAGRFVSAEAALMDAVALSPDDAQAQMSLALSHIALGRWDAARALLNAAAGKVGESDRGLALALAGDKEGGLVALERAARAEGADAKARQNYAFGLALAGRWAEARSVAGQDLNPAQLKARLSEWALLSQPKEAWDQVAALLHVTPVQDAGMPVTLALSASTRSGLAAATVSPAALREAPMVQALPAEPRAPEFAEAVLPASMPAMRDATSARLSPPVRAKFAPTPVRQTTRGRYVVQLGAYSSANKVESAWRGMARRFGSVARLAPSSAAFGTPQGGTMYRLSLAGIESREAATGLCRQIRAASGACFVRASAGDALASWNGGSTRIATR